MEMENDQPRPHRAPQHTVMFVTLPAHRPPAHQPQAPHHTREILILNNLISGIKYACKQRCRRHMAVWPLENKVD